MPLSLRTGYLQKLAAEGMPAHILQLSAVPTKAPKGVFPVQLTRRHSSWRSHHHHRGRRRRRHRCSRHPWGRPAAEQNKYWASRVAESSQIMARQHDRRCARAMLTPREERLPAEMVAARL